MNRSHGSTGLYRSKRNRNTGVGMALGVQVGRLPGVFGGFGVGGGFYEFSFFERKIPPPELGLSLAFSFPLFPFSLLLAYFFFLYSFVFVLLFRYHSTPLQSGFAPEGLIPVDSGFVPFRQIRVGFDSFQKFYNLFFFFFFFMGC